MPSPVCVLAESARTVRRLDDDIIGGIRYGAAVPRGFTSASFTLSRPLRVLPPDVDPYTRIVVTDRRTAEVLWEGWVEIPGRDSGQGAELYDVTAVGPAAHATDNARALSYIDSRFDQWEPRGAANGNVGTVLAGDNAYRLQVHVPRGTVTAPVAYYVQATYDRFVDNLQRVGRLDATWYAGVADPGWEARVYVGPNLVYQADVDTTGATVVRAVGTHFTSGPGDVSLRLARTGTTGPVGDDDTWVRWGLPLRVQCTRYTAAGAELVTGASYPSSTIVAHNVINDLLGRPGLLPLYDGEYAQIVTASTVPITQLAYDDGATPAQIMADLMELDPGLYWAVWERNPRTGRYRFEWSAYPTVASVWADTSSRYTSQPSVADLANVVRVRWRDLTGRTRQSIYTQEVPALTAMGRTRTKVVDIGGNTGSQDQADARGAGELAASKFPTNNGSLRVRQPVVDVYTGRSVPPHRTPLLAGRLLRLSDVESRPDWLNGSDRDGVSVFRIAAVEYDDRAREATLTLDGYDDTMTAALRRMRTRLGRLAR